jgi:prepilin-type N-terminal cleavage/methylation domain-containing protein
MPSPVSSTRRCTPTANRSRSRAGFTLVEMLIVLVVLSVLASLSLAGLAGAAQRGKIEKTKSTIRKLNEIVMSQYEGYLRRRVAFTASTNRVTAARNRLLALRTLMAQELPDQWADVYTVSAIPGNATGPTRAYAYYAAGLPGRTTRYQGPECLWMIIERGGLNAEGGADHFREDEQGDLDKDGALEFWDGWGRPIDFIRWPAGFSSIVQRQNASANPDPFDPLRVSGTVDFPSGTTQRDYALIPLIYSAGPDEATNTQAASSGDGYGIKGGPVGWIDALSITSGTLTTRLYTTGTLAGTVTNSAAAADNIFNHDLMKK